MNANAELSTLFTKISGREPTSTDLGYLSTELEYPELRPTLTSPDYFDSKLNELARNHNIDTEELKKMIRKRATREAEVQREERERKTKRTKTVNYVGH